MQRNNSVYHTSTAFLRLAFPAIPWSRWYSDNAIARYKILFVTCHTKSQQKRNFSSIVQKPRNEKLLDLNTYLGAQQQCSPVHRNTPVDSQSNPSRQNTRSTLRASPSCCAPSNSEDETSMRS